MLRKNLFLLVILLQTYSNLFASIYDVPAYNKNIDISKLIIPGRISIVVISFSGCPPCRTLERKLDSMYQNSVCDTAFLDIYFVDLRKDDKGVIKDYFQRTVRKSDEVLQISSFPNIFLFSIEGKFVERFEYGSTNFILKINDFISNENNILKVILAVHNDSGNGQLVNQTDTQINNYKRYIKTLENILKFNIIELSNFYNEVIIQNDNSHRSWDITKDFPLDTTQIKKDLYEAIQILKGIYNKKTHEDIGEAFCTIANAQEGELKRIKRKKELVFHIKYALECYLKAQEYGKDCSVEIKSLKELYPKWVK